MINEAFKRDLKKFDRDQVLPAWDSLVYSQQTKLARYDVPAMFVTKSLPDRQVSGVWYVLEFWHLLKIEIQRQQRVMKVLEGIVKDE